MWKDAKTGRVARWGGALRGGDGQTSRLRGVLRGEPQAAVRRTVRHHGQPRRGRGDPPGRIPEAVGAVGPRIHGGGPGGVPVPHRDQPVPEPAAPGPGGRPEDPDAGAQHRRPGGGGVPERPDQHPAGAHPPTAGSAGPDRLPGLLVGGGRPGAGGPGLHGASPGHPGSGVRPSEGGGADVIDQRERFERAFELFDMPEPAMARLVAHRHRKERNRRIGTAVVAVAVAAAAFGGLARAFLSGPGPRPAVEGVEEPPVDPAVGELVLHLRGDAEVAIYADGRVIWEIGDGDPGYLQMRLTPEGVELLRSRAVSTGLFERDQGLTLDDDPGFMEVRRGDRSVIIVWGEDTSIVESWPSALLPRRMYAEPESSPFVPSRLLVTWDAGTPDWSTLPSPAREIVSGNLDTLTRDGCQVISTDQARTIARALAQAGIDTDYNIQRGMLSFSPDDSFVHSFPALPHEVACETRWPGEYSGSD